MKKAKEIKPKIKKLKRQLKKKPKKKKKIPKKKVKQEESKEELEEKPEDLEIAESQEMEDSSYPPQGSSALNRRQSTPLEQQASQMPLSQTSSEDGFKGYSSAKAGTYDSGSANVYNENSDSGNPYDAGEKKESSKDLRGYEGLSSSKEIKDDKGQNAFTDTMAGARGQVQDISQTYNALERETETYQQFSKQSTEEIDTTKATRGMKKESVEF